MRENVSANTEKLSFQEKDQIIKDSQTKMEALTIDETKSSGNGYLYFINCNL